MYDDLNELILLQIDKMHNLLELLEEQHDYIIKQDVFNMDSIITKLKDAAVEIAKLEMDRRNLVGNKSVSEVVIESHNSELEKNYRNIRRILHEVNLQKDTNELLIRQQLSFTNNMLCIINPSRPTSKTYGATGKIKR